MARKPAPKRKPAKSKPSPRATKPPHRATPAPPPAVEPKRPAHRPRYQPTDQGRAQVVAMVIADIDQDMIAKCLGITAKTLRRAYRRELDTSYAVIKADIASKLVTKARAGDLKAQMFFLEFRAGWMKSQHVEADLKGALTITIDRDDAGL